MAQVAVITRTMTRPYMLRRAIQSVLSQTHDDFQMVIINDGGDPKHVDIAFDIAFREAPHLEYRKNKIKVIHLPKNRGMEAASNEAIKSSDSKYIVIHDDDDTWHPAFLHRTVDYIENSKFKTLGGVVTKTLIIEEEVVGEHIKFLRNYPFAPAVKYWDTNPLYDMNRRFIPFEKILDWNFWAPISFLFKRDIYNKIGGYAEELPVLGDWDFNIRFLSVADIGILHRFLAHYHLRFSADSATGNTVISGKHKHVTYYDYVRNNYSRLRAPGDVGIDKDALKRIFVHMPTTGTIQEVNREWKHWAAWYMRKFGSILKELDSIVSGYKKIKDARRGVKKKIKRTLKFVRRVI